MQRELRKNIVEWTDKVFMQPNEPSAAHAQIKGTKTVQKFTDPGV